MTQDPNHWLYQHAPREWIRAGLSELSRAEAAFVGRDRRGALALCRRAAGMALNGMLALAKTPDTRYGRSYMDHLVAMTEDASAPEEAREAARLLVQTPMPGTDLVALRTAQSDARLLEATKTVMAHAYALVLRESANEAPSEQ